VVSPLFYVRPGDESFVPQVSHPGEDAGADICAHVTDTYDRDDAIDFYREFESASLRHGTRLYVDGEVFTSESENEFLDVLDQCGGAVLLGPGCTELVNSGFKVILPNLKNLSFPWNSLVSVYKIVPRSGLSNKHGILVTNSPGIIDSGYRGWVKVSLTNSRDNYHVFTHGSRIAQGLCEMVFDQSGNKSTTNENVFEVTGRSTGGFGSTGV
jgi:deoxyuridine 5'-triphosphate nucleotidohydrolase